MVCWRDLCPAQQKSGLRARSNYFFFFLAFFFAGILFAS